MINVVKLFSCFKRKTIEIENTVCQNHLIRDIVITKDRFVFNTGTIAKLTVDGKYVLLAKPFFKKVLGIKRTSLLVINYNYNIFIDKGDDYNYNRESGGFITIPNQSTLQQIECITESDYADIDLVVESIILTKLKKVII